MKISNFSSLKTKNNNKISFKSKIVNGHVYSDKIYKDAIAAKRNGYIKVDIPFLGLNFFPKFYFKRMLAHDTAVRSCMNDMKEEEQKLLNKRKEIFEKLEAEKAAIEEQSCAVEKEIIRSKQEIKIKSFNYEPSDNFSSFDLYQDQKKEIIETLLTPIKITDNDAGYETVPNGILIAGANSDRRREVSKVIAAEILGKNNLHRFTKIRNTDNDEQFEENMCAIKETSQEEYEATKARTVLYMDNFDHFAPNKESKFYSQSKNCFLKNYFLDCADCGCLIIAAVQNKENIDEPFIINKKRFGLIIDL